ncbi:MAG: tRNA pseudouridine(38-40) synthase TruA [Huintestinicola sp.]
MRNLKVTMGYRGTAYHGFQRQENAVGIQNILEDKLSRMTDGHVKINGCSRTDTGVHANMYVFSFETEHRIPCNNLVRGMNSILPDDIALFSCEEADADFHARYSCVGKEYIYVILNRMARDPFLGDLSLHYPYPLDVDKMNRAAGDIVGTHDFTSFCGTANQKENAVRTITKCCFHREGDKVVFTIRGDGFLYNMVRIAVGTLLYINEGRIGENDIPIILAARDRNLAGKTACASGLYLNRVFYDSIPND